jgi:hypothetical protein
LESVQSRQLLSKLKPHGRSRVDAAAAEVLNRELSLLHHFGDPKSLPQCLLESLFGADGRYPKLAQHFVQ